MSTDAKLILKLRAETDALSRDLNKAKNKIKRFEGKATSIAQGIEGAMLKAFSVSVISQGLSHAIRSMADFEFAMDKVAAISGASSLEINNLRENAINLASASKFTTKEIAGLQLALSKLGFSADKIERTTEAVSKLAIVADEDLASSAKTMAGTLNSFNMAAFESDRVANVMAESFSKSALDLEKFTVATANSGAIANTLGVTLEENTARLGALVDANIDASKAGTDLRRIYLDLNKAGISYEDALDKVENSLDKVGVAQELVGDRAAGALVILSKQRKKVNELTSELSDNNEELDKMAEIMGDNLISKWRKFVGAIDAAIQRNSGLSELAGNLLDVATNAVKFLGGGITTETQQKSAWDKQAEGLIKYVDSTKEGLALITSFADRYKDRLKEAQEQFEKIKKQREDRDIWGISAVNAETEARVEAEKLEYVYGKLAIIQGQITDKFEKQNKELKEQKRLLDDAAKTKAREEALSSFPTKKLRTITEGIPLSSQKPDMKSFEEVTGTKVEMQRADDSIKFLEDYKAKLQAIADDLNGIIDGTIKNAITGLAMTLGSGGGVEQAMAGLLDVLGTGLIDLGKALISTATIFKAIRETLSEGIKAHPGLAIAAGAVAIAAGAALKKRSADISANMAGGGGGGGGGGSFSMDRTGQSMNLGGEFVVKGQDLALVLNNQNRLDNRNRG